MYANGRLNGSCISLVGSLLRLYISRIYGLLTSCAASGAWIASSQFVQY